MHRSSRPLISSTDLLGLAALVVLAATIGCASPQPAEPTATEEPANVVLVVIDTLRADRLGAYGYERSTSPFFDGLAETAVLFDQARAAASCTSPSVNSILTSRNPFLFRDSDAWPGIPDTMPTMASLLGERGYSTAAVSASPIVRRTPSNHNPVGGFGHGFDRFDESCMWRPASCVSARSLEAVDVLEEPFFLYAHYMDPHDPYRAEARFRGRFADTDDAHLPKAIREGQPNALMPWLRDGSFDDNVAPEHIAHLEALYDEEILAADAGLRKLVGGLRKRGLLERTHLIVTSDHGEAFLEHGYLKHCYSVYDEEVRVPLLVRTADGASGRSSIAASLLDLLPTILDLAGAEAHPEAEGGSLRRWLAQPPEDAAAATPTDGRRLTFSGMGPYRAVTDGRWKLIDDLRAEPRLYDLEIDAGETTDVLDTERRTFRELESLLTVWVEAGERGIDPQESLDRGRELEEKLRSLGYLG
ncbi:MAG: sulfatase [Acidobacteriota bacterium]